MLDHYVLPTTSYAGWDKRWDKHWEKQLAVLISRVSKQDKPRGFHSSPSTRGTPWLPIPAATGFLFWGASNAPSQGTTFRNALSVAKSCSPKSCTWRAWFRIVARPQNQRVWRTNRKLEGCNIDFEREVPNAWRKANQPASGLNLRM